MNEEPSVAPEIGLCLLFSAVDGDVSESELGALSSRVGHLLGDDFDVSRLPSLVDFELTSMAAAGVDAYVAKLAARILPERRFEAVRAACVVACADGLAAEEEEILRHVCRELDVDVDDVIRAVGARFDTLQTGGDSHDDEPNEITAIITEALVPTGWVDPMQAMRDAGISVSGFGALALQYQASNGHLLRLEHHTCDASIHFHVTDDEEEGTDLVLFADGKEREVLAIVSAMQNVVTRANLATWIAKLQRAARVCRFEGDELVELQSPR